MRDRNPGCERQYDEVLDKSAVRRTLDGNREAFSQIVARHGPLLYSLAYHSLGGEAGAAQEAVQEILLKAYRSLSRFDTSRRFFPWLYTIALNHLRSVKRHERSRQRVFSLERVEFTAVADQRALSPDDAAINREGERLVREALRLLSPPQREAFVLREVECLSVAAVAEIMRLPENTVKTHVFRARKRLRALLLRAGWE